MEFNIFEKLSRSFLEFSLVFLLSGGFGQHRRFTLLLCPNICRIRTRLAIHPASLSEFQADSDNISDSPCFPVRISSGFGQHHRFTLLLCPNIKRIRTTSPIHPASLSEFQADSDNISDSPCFPVRISSGFGQHRRFTLLPCPNICRIRTRLAIHPASLSEFQADSDNIADSPRFSVRISSGFGQHRRFTLLLCPNIWRIRTTLAFHDVCSLSGIFPVMFHTATPTVYTNIKSREFINS